MQRARQQASWASALGSIAVLAALVLGILLRLEDPLSTSVVPAEDPYAHMDRLKQHIHAGAIQPPRPGVDLYPPGMHAMLAVAWTFTGAELYDLVRFAPTVLGAIGILGTAVLLEKHAGPLAAFVGALTVAVAPEIVFRTTMMAPTAVDLAVLPVLLFTLVALIEGDLAWSATAAVLGIFLVFAHPWVLGILALTGILVLVWVVLIPQFVPTHDWGCLRGVAAAMAIVGGSLALAVSTCRGTCGPGFQRVLPLGSELEMLAPVLLIGSLLPAAIMALGRGDAIRKLLPERGALHSSLRARLCFVLILAVALIVVTWQALQGGLPPDVDLPRMLGWPMLGLAALGFLALPFVSGSLVHIAAAIVIATYPLVVFNPLDSEFWPHRTVVYLGVGLSILAGVAAASLAKGARRAYRRLRPTTDPSSSTLMLAVGPLLLAAALGASIYTQTPGPYDEGWYRLYEPCEMDALREEADRLATQTQPRVITGDWRPAIVLRATASPDAQFWFSHSFFVNEDERGGVIAATAAEKRSLYVVEDRHTRTATEQAEHAFLESEDWLTVERHCPGLSHDGQPQLVSIHRFVGTAP